MTMPIVIEGTVAAEDLTADELAARARRMRNQQSLEEARLRAEQSRIKLGVAALFGLRNV